MANITTGQRIAQQRKLLNLSQEALGDQLKVSRQAVSKWEADAALPEVENLVAMSRLFGVSVGWLLGVEESLAEHEAPQVPSRQPKWLVPLAAVCTAAALILAGVCAYRAHTLDQQLKGFRAEIAGLSNEMGIVSDFDFACTPWQSMDGADFVFTGIPSQFTEGSTCELVVYLENEEAARTTCDWDGHRYSAAFSLDAADGYACYLVMTDSFGNQWQANLPSELLSKLGQDLSGGCHVTGFLDGMSLTRDHLTLRELTCSVDLPDVFQDTPELWQKFDLTLLQNGKEIGRIDLLKNYRDSTIVDFSKPDLNFSVRNLDFYLTEAVASGDKLVLRLECGLSTGHLFYQEVKAWTVD